MSETIYVTIVQRPEIETWPLTRQNSIQPLSSIRRSAVVNKIDKHFYLLPDFFFRGINKL